MKFIVTGDIHLSLYSNDPIIKESGLPLRLHTLNKVLRSIVNYARDKGINNIAILGDIFHTKSIIHVLAQSILLDFVRDCKDIQFIIINGNHDYSSRSGKGVSALKCLDSESNVMMLHHPRLIDNILFVPWGDSMVDDIRDGDSDYLAAHIGLNEAQLSSGISIVSDIGITNLRQYKCVLLAHFHKPQTLGNVTYVGSPIQLDWGEKHEEKRFLVVDSEEDIIESIPVTGYKKHFEFVITKENKDEIIEKARKAKEDGDFINIVKKEEVDTDDIANEFRIVDKVQVDVTNRGLSSTMSQIDRVRRYMEIKGIKKEQWELYEKTAIEIIESVTDGN